MKKIITAALLFSTMFLGAGLPAQTAHAACAGGGGILGVPTWYKYLDTDTALSAASGSCKPEIKEYVDGILILFAIIEIMARIAMYIAIIMVIYGGIRMIVSQGSVEEVKKARETLINAIVGLVIALISVGIVNLAGGLLG